MIRFFRTIRQSLLAQGRITRYLTYAVGEIVLVVIGILIALSINNASAEARTRNKELVLLKEMRQNLVADLQDVRFNVTGNRKRIRANEAALKAFQDLTPLSDTLRTHYGNILGNFQLSENTAAWENLKSVGIDLISDDSLRNAVSALYSTRYKYLENVEKGLDDDYQWNRLYPMVLKHLNVEAMWVTATPVDHEALLADREFQEVVKMNLFIRGYLQDQYETVEKDIERIIKMIDGHIRELEASN